MFKQGDMYLEDTSKSMMLKKRQWTFIPFLKVVQHNLEGQKISHRFYQKAREHDATKPSITTSRSS